MAQAVRVAIGEGPRRRSRWTTSISIRKRGSSGTFDDPEKRLSGRGKTGRRLTLRSVDEIPTKAVRGWLRTAAELARKKG